MPRLFPITALAFLVFASACEYAPLAVDENRPGLSDSVIDPEIVVYGTSTYRYLADGGDSYDCELVHDIQGWLGAPSVGRSCTTCSRVYTIFRTARDTDCPFLLPQTHAIGWDLLDNVRDDPWGTRDVSTEEWLAADGQSGVVAALRTTWTIRGYTEDPVWEARFVLEEVDEDEWPDPPDGVEFTSAYTARDRFLYAIDRNQDATWRMALQFSD
jgi:hypothetical protein